MGQIRMINFTFLAHWAFTKVNFSSFFFLILCFDADSVDLLLQGGGQSAGHGPEQHLQEDEAAGREAGRAVPEPAGDCQRSGQRGPTGHQGVPVPVQIPPVELHQPQQVLWKNTAAR